MATGTFGRIPRLSKYCTIVAGWTSSEGLETCLYDTVNFRFVIRGFDEVNAGVDCIITFHVQYPSSSDTISSNIVFYGRVNDANTLLFSCAFSNTISVVTTPNKL